MNNFYTSLTGKQKLYFNHYKSNDPFFGSIEFATHLNGMLMKGHMAAEWQEACDILDDIIKLNLIVEEIQLFRATSIDFVDPFISDGKFLSPAFISTSTDKESVKEHYRGIPQDTTPVLLRIECPAGSGIASLENDTTSGLEKEMLLGRYQEFTITSDKIHSDPAIIRHIMDPDLAKGFEQIRVIDLALNNSAINSSEEVQSDILN
ncbi:MAG: hypothetical protein JWP78_626 [Mucilaginibacter sp.]|nr:hypothetical protein [Mucilaginibacter sp.]